MVGHLHLRVGNAGDAEAWWHRELGMQTVAEGIETPTQLAQLRRTRCTAVQGFLLARPMSASQVANLLADETPRMRALS